MVGGIKMYNLTDREKDEFIDTLSDTLESTPDTIWKLLPKDIKIKMLECYWEEIIEIVQKGDL